MRPRDWLLLYFALKGAPRGLDPVRIQKGMFLFAQEADVAPDEVYTFGAYHYGPMSSAIYADVDRLEVEGLISGESVPGYSWKRYRITPRGLDAARALRDHADRAAVRKLFDIKASIAGKSFSKLLRDVYEKYPEYATRSVFQR